MKIYHQKTWLHHKDHKDNAMNLIKIYINYFNININTNDINKNDYNISVWNIF